MATAAQSAPEWPHSFAWLRDFLRQELAPYPGRGVLVARMVLTATIVMVINNTFRIPYGAYGAIYALTISRENPDATINAVRIILVSYVFAVADVLVGALLFTGDPSLRLIWVIGTLFIMFYALSALANYTAAARFGYLVVITIPLWDQQIPGEAKVENTLWAVGAISMASVITAIIEYAFAKLRPWDDLNVSISERLEWIERLVRSWIEGLPNKASEQQVVRLSTLGTSRMRRDLSRSGYSAQYEERMGAVVVSVGRLVDIAANLTFFSDQISTEERNRLRHLCQNIASIRDDLLNSRVPHLVEPYPEGGSRSTIPLLQEMERTVSLIVEAFAGGAEASPFARPALPAEPHPMRIFAPDAFTNPEHLYFALKGGLAASLCYVIYNLVAWPGISTAVTTCLLTALTTIGSSRQKQALRFGGALLGGAIGLTAQVFILPALDSITGFLLLFVAVSIVAAWIITSGPRLSYLGAQMAVAFYLINLEEFRFQTSLAVARDRVAGILLGLFMMWLLFDQLWGVPSAAAMKRTFVSTLRLLARFVREPVSFDLRVALEKSYALRETINTNMDRLRQYGDGVMLEFGPSRQRDLALREKLIQWQLALRMIFVSRIALLKYRLHLPGFELPAPLQAAQKDFDIRFAARLESMADRLEGKVPAAPEIVDSSIEQLEQAALACCAKEPPEQPAAPLQTFLPLTRRVDGLLRSIEQEIG
jgi:multidrug resistance protein MdtO